MALPVLTAEERRNALDKAAATRAAQSAAIEKIRAGEITIADVMADENSPLAKVFVRRLLLATPRIGAVATDEILDRLGVDNRRRLSGLGPKQREQLAEILAARLTPA